MVDIRDLMVDTRERSIRLGVTEVTQYRCTKRNIDVQSEHLSS